MPLLILDRDGVLNQPVTPCVAAPAQWLALPGALEAIARAGHAGWRVVVACNEPAVGRGELSLEALLRVHAAMLQHVHEAGGNLDAVFFHPGAEPEHAWRWPHPGLLEAALKRFHVAPADAVAVGASPGFVQAARAAGIRTLLIAPNGRGDGEVPAHPSLGDAVVGLLAPP